MMGLRSSFPRKRDLDAEDFRSRLEKGMRLEWRKVYGKWMKVKVYPPAYAAGLAPDPEKPRHE